MRQRSTPGAIFRTLNSPSTSSACSPLTELEPGLFVLELSNGPTAAFKDIALQLLGNLFEYALANRGTSLNILGATSGDTGSSAEYAMRGKRGLRVFMLSPQGKMSPFQTAQMFSLVDPNIFNIAIRGVFDDCQDIVKAVSNDAAFKHRHCIGTVNSINWARVAAQIVYYFRAYFAATRSNGEPIAFAVPSGNFGNILAGHIAKSMGLPIRRLILATNENDVLDEFFKSGVYRVRASGDVLSTSSPSMDISKASNFERFVFDLVERDAAVVRTLWHGLEAGAGRFDLSATPFWKQAGKFGFVSGKSTHADRIATIRMVHSRYGRMIDPHTADGVKVGLEHRESGVPLVCLETALPVKFAETIREALGFEPQRPAAFTGLESLPQRFEVVAADARAIMDHIARNSAS
jgi:threonine synthase